MACKGCEERRKTLDIWKRAMAEWLKKPAGPSPHEIARRIEEEEKAK
jgi:hypothetical protein